MSPMRDQGGESGHLFNTTNSQELMRWDGVVVWNVNEFVGNSWNSRHENQYNPVISSTMTYSRWRQLKGNMKLCLFYEEKKKGEDGYDPTIKYRKIWDVLTYNLNQFVERGGLDLTVDETTWSNGSYAEIHSKIRNKPGASKGGQHTLVVDSVSRFIYGYTPRHKHFKRVAPFTQEGPAEVKQILDILDPIVIGVEKEEHDKRRQFFPEKPSLGMDNHFSGGPVRDEIGERGYGGIWTTRRDWLPKGCKDYFHHIKATPVDGRSKAARFEQPIVAVMNVFHPPESAKKSYTALHVSFQSTGSCNITAVNTLKEVNLYVRQREKGRGKSKRFWAIEMNQGRELYLKTYSAIDKIDQMLKNWFIFYVSWKWWHAPMRHGKALAYCMAYQMYRECALGFADPEWKLDKPMDGPEFRQVLGTQMCEYRAANLQYPGDEFVRNATKTLKKKRGKNKRLEDSLEKCEDAKFQVSYAQYLDAKRPRGKDSRLCSNNLDLLKEHLRSFKSANVGRGQCQVCGKTCYFKCTKCDVHCCFKDDGNASSVSCCIDYHNDDFFGLTLGDRVSLFGEQKKNYKKPTKAEAKKNQAHIAKLNKKYIEDMEENDN